MHNIDDNAYAEVTADVEHKLCCPNMSSETHRHMYPLRWMHLLCTQSLTSTKLHRTVEMCTVCSNLTFILYWLKKKKRTPTADGRDTSSVRCC